MRLARASGGSGGGGGIEKLHVTRTRAVIDDGILVGLTHTGSGSGDDTGEVTGVTVPP